MTVAAIPLFTLLDLALQNAWTASLTGAACAVLVSLNARYIARPLLLTSVLLIVVSTLLLPMLDSPWAVLQKGLRMGALVASLLVSTALLSRAVTRVDRVRCMMDDLFRGAPNGRYPRLSIATQLYGGLLGLTGITMLMESAAQQRGFTHAEKLSSFCAISRGYASVSLWSPMYSNLSIVLGLYAGTQWLPLLPAALLVSVLFMLVGMLLDYSYHRRAGLRVPVPTMTSARKSVADCASALVARQSLARQRTWPVLLAMLTFLLMILGISHFSATPISAVIIVGAPLAAFLIHSCISRVTDRPIAAAGQHIYDDLSAFKLMSGEVLMFLASGCAGTVIAATIPQHWISGVASLIGPSPSLTYLLLSTLIVILSTAAIHPMLSAVIVGSTLTPSLLGTPLVPHLSAVLAGWALAIILSPYSVISALANRWSGIPIVSVSLCANALYALLALGVSATVLGWLTPFFRP